MIDPTLLVLGGGALLLGLRARAQRGTGTAAPSPGTPAPRLGSVPTLILHPPAMPTGVPRLGLGAGGPAPPTRGPLAPPTSTAPPTTIPSDTLSGSAALAYAKQYATAQLGRAPSDAEWAWLTARAGIEGYTGGTVSRAWLDRFLADASRAYPAAFPPGSYHPPAPNVPPPTPTPAPTLPSDTLSGDAAIAYAHNVGLQQLGRPLTDAEWAWLTARAAAAGYTGGPVSRTWLDAFLQSAATAYPAAFPAATPPPVPPPAAPMPTDQMSASDAIAYAHAYAQAALGRPASDAEWNWLTARAAAAGYTGGPISRAWLDRFLADASAAYAGAFPAAAAPAPPIASRSSPESVAPPPAPPPPAVPPSGLPDPLPPSVTVIDVVPPPQAAPAPAAPSDLMSQDAAVAYAHAYAQAALGRPATDAEWNWLTARANAAGYSGGPISRAWLDAFLADASRAYPSAGF